MKLLRLMALCCAFGMVQTGLSPVKAQAPSQKVNENQREWLQTAGLTSEWVDLAFDNHQNVWTVATEYPLPIVFHSFTTVGGQKKRVPLNGKYKGTIEAVKILHTPDGNLIVAGHFSGKLTIGNFKVETAFAGSDLFILSYRPETQKVNFLKKIDLGGDEKARALINDSDGNLYLGGYTETNGISRAYLVKANDAAQVLWQQIAEKDPAPTASASASAGTSAVFALAPNPKGGVYATGWFDRTLNWGNQNALADVGSDIFLTAVSESGDVHFLKSFGGTDWEAGRAITTDPAGNIYLGGWFWGSLPFGNNHLVSRGASDLFLAKFNPAGELLHVASYGSTQSDALFDLRWEQNKLWGCGWFSEKYTLGSTTLSATGNKDAFAFQADAEGQILKATTWGGNDEDKAHAILIDPNDAVAYIIGYHNREGNLPTDANNDYAELAFSFVAKWGEKSLPLPVNPQSADPSKKILIPQPLTEIYPNPAREYINVRLENVAAGNYLLSLTDMTGKTILSTEPYFDAVQDRFTWMLPSLASGHYVLNIRQGTQILSTNKIMIP